VTKPAISLLILELNDLSLLSNCSDTLFMNVIIFGNILLALFFFISCSKNPDAGLSLSKSLIIFLEKKDAESPAVINYTQDLVEKINSRSKLKIDLHFDRQKENFYQSFFEGKGDLLASDLIVKNKNKNLVELYSEGDLSEPKIYCLQAKLKDTYHCSLDKLSISTSIVENLFYLIKVPVNDEKSYIWPIKATFISHYYEITNWFKSYKNLIFMAKLNESHFSQVGLFGGLDLIVLKKRYKKVLPRYINFFKEAAKKYHLDPLFLSAISYQESHWNRYAKSPTGVRGLMMLTRSTARSMGIHNRMDPKNSIFGGAKYYRRIHENLPTEITLPDRDWFALAAYNVGLGHLFDAQTLTKEKGLNENLWPHVRESLPHLAEKKYYRRLKYGRARGHEPVKYVKNIRRFYAALKKLGQQHQI